MSSPSRLRRVPSLVVALTLVGSTAVAATATTTFPSEHLEAARAAMTARGIDPGGSVDPADLLRLARAVGVNVGRVVDPDDLVRVLAAAGQPVAAVTPPPVWGPATAAPETLAGFFPAFGLGYGAVVDAADVRRLAERLGIGVGRVVDPEDVARVAAAAGRHIDVRHPVFATVGGVSLRLPSASVELVGFHESNHDGARQLAPASGAARSMTLPSRGRGTGSRSAADIVVAPGVEIRSPVSGRVLRSGTYVLYCRYSDDYAVIEPDDRPGWEVKLLHIDGVRVSPGDRVEAGATVIAKGPTPLPFRSQVDKYSAGRNWPHVHLEVVDPSIPDRPSPGGGC